MLSGVNVPLLIGSFVGSKLATAIKSFDTVGGQIGAAVGGLYAGYASTVALANLATGAAAAGGTAQAALAFAAANPVAAVAIVAAIVLLDTLLGGLIGSIFGGTPRSGADVTWDSESGKFEVANVYARKGGSRDAAVQTSQSVANTFNAILQATGSKLLDATQVQTGNYGMRKKDFVYRPIATRDKEAITARFSGKNAAEQLIKHGAYLGLSSMIGQLGGGDVYVKRAVVADLAFAGGNPASNAPGAAGTFDANALLGDITIAQDYRQYLNNSTAIQALIAAEPESSFAAAWLATLARAVELGLTRRALTDWIGGFGLWLDELTDGKIDGIGISPALLTAGLDPTSSGRYWAVSDANGEFSSFVEDTIDVAGQDQIGGTAGADTIRLAGDQLLATNGSINASLTLNGAAFDGAAKAIAVAATVDAGDGDDLVYASDRGDNVLGGAGNDTLIGGKLDDWLLGGDGDDKLYAGAVADGAVSSTTALNADGGSGNYLDGGAGNDKLYGSTGSDWLAGGDGVDELYGGDGGDVLNAGTSGDAVVQGGGGSDQYVFNRGDGQDVYFDAADPNATPGVAGDSIGQTVRDRTSGVVSKNWAGDGAFTVDGSTKGGDDAISFGPDITMHDLVLLRSGYAGAPGSDMIIRVLRADGTWQVGDDQITIQDWFEGTRRIEWLRFANGEEVRIGSFMSFQAGTAGNDVLIGTNGNDFQYGGDGNDQILGLGGDDFGSGGLGNDMVAGNDDNDGVFGGQGDAANDNAPTRAAA